MARRRKTPKQLELSDRDYARLQRRLADVQDADTRQERRDAEASLERLAEQLELDDDVVDALLDGDVELRDSDDDSDDDRRRDDRDDDRGRSPRRARSRARDDDDDRATGTRRPRRLVAARSDDDSDDDDGDDDDGDDRRRDARSLKDMSDDPNARPPRRPKEDRKPERTPDTTHWFHQPLIRRGQAAS